MILFVNWLIIMVSVLFKFYILTCGLTSVYSFLDLTEANHAELERVVAEMRQRVMEDRLNAALQAVGIEPDDISNQFNTTLQLNLEDLLDQ